MSDSEVRASLVAVSPMNFGIDKTLATYFLVCFFGSEVRSARVIPDRDEFPTGTLAGRMNAAGHPAAVAVSRLPFPHQMARSSAVG